MRKTGRTPLPGREGGRGGRGEGGERGVVKSVCVS